MGLFGWGKKKETKTDEINTIFNNNAGNDATS